MNKTKNLYDTAKPMETAVLVALITQKQTQQKANEYLDELSFLAETSGIKTLQIFTQKLERPDIRTFVGKGKLADIVAYVKDKNVDMVIFDDDLSPGQVRNLENELKCKILDRSLLILNIFSIRAKTSAGQNPSRAGPIPIYFAPPHQDVDPFNQAKRWGWHERGQVKKNLKPIAGLLTTGLLSSKKN